MSQSDTANLVAGILGNRRPRPAAPVASSAGLDQVDAASQTAPVPAHADNPPESPSASNPTPTRSEAAEPPVRAVPSGTGARKIAVTVIVSREAHRWLRGTAMRRYVATQRTQADRSSCSLTNLVLELYGSARAQGVDVLSLDPGCPSAPTRLLVSLDPDAWVSMNEEVRDSDAGNPSGRRSISSAVRGTLAWAMGQEGRGEPA